MALLSLLTVSVPLTPLLKFQIKLVTIQMISNGFYGDSIIFETLQFFSLRDIPFIYNFVFLPKGDWQKNKEYIAI